MDKMKNFFIKAGGRIKSTFIKTGKSLKSFFTRTGKLIKSAFVKSVAFIRNAAVDKGEFSLRNSLIIILLLSVWTVIYQMIAQSFNVHQLYGPILLFNIIPIFLVMLLMYFIIGKISYSFIVTNTLLSVLLLVNHYKIKFRDEPLTPTDFSLGREANNILKNYDITIDGIVIVTIAVCAFSFWFVLKKIRNKRPGLWISVAGIVSVLAVSAGVYGLVYKNTRIYNALLSNLGIYHEATVVSSKGLVYSLLNNTSVMKYTKDEKYSEEFAKQILNRYPDNKLPENTPDVVAVMCEAFTDIQDWGKVEFLDENPYENINELRKNACYGEIFVPGFGGGTSSTEFEFLTGNNTSSISPSMPTAYKTLITKSTYSIARLFKDAGFDADAMHPGNGWFYNRRNVYNRMGFDSFTSREDWEEAGHEVPTIHGMYADDTVSSDMIISGFEKHLEKNAGNGYFNFTVTIQNHGPYDDTHLIYGKEYIKRVPGMTNAEYNIINNYLGGIKAADEFVKTVYDYINTLEKPTVFIFFGDHLPYLDDEENIWKELGLDIASENIEAYENKYSTDYFIIGNRAFMDEFEPSISGKQDLISANYLSVKLFQYMNIELPQFQAFLNEMMQFAPLITKSHNGKADTFDETFTEKQQIMLNEYKILQYRNIKDYNTEEGDSK